MNRVASLVAVLLSICSKEGIVGMMVVLTVPWSAGQRHGGIRRRIDIVPSIHPTCSTHSTHVIGSYWCYRLSEEALELGRIDDSRHFHHLMLQFHVLRVNRMGGFSTFIFHIPFISLPFSLTLTMIPLQGFYVEYDLRIIAATPPSQR